MNILRRSIGTGKMTVEWCSADISVSVWSMRSWRVVGVAAITLPASASFSAAWYSPSAWIPFARRSRPAPPPRGRPPLPPPLALRLGLAGDDPDHLRGQTHVAHLHDGHLNAPGLRRLVDDLLQPLVDLLPLAEQLVEVRLSEDAAQGGL